MRAADPQLRAMLDAYLTDAELGCGTGALLAEAARVLRPAGCVAMKRFVHDPWRARRLPSLARAAGSSSAPCAVTAMSSHSYRASC